MKKYIFLVNIIYFLFASLPIKEIIIKGNKITQDDFILNTINHQIGDTINIDLANQDMLNLYQTGLFEDVIIHAPADSIYYIYLLNEKKRILPFPIIDKDDLLGFSYGGGILFNNIKGMNKKLEFSISAGEILLYNLTYYNPKSSIANDTLKINFHKKRFDNIENDYLLDKSIFKSSIDLLTQNKLQEIKFSIEYEYNKISFIANNKTKKNQSISAIVSYRKNTYLNKYQKGNILDVNYKVDLFNVHYPNNITLELLNKYYIPFSTSPGQIRLLIKNQTKINFSKNIPIYNKIYIGTENHVRGYNPNPLKNPLEIQNRLKSNNMIISTLQLEISLIKKQLMDISLLLFADWGFSANHYKYFNIKDKIRSHGIGVRFDIIKYFNVDLFLGFNPYKYKQFHIIFNAKKF